MKKMHFPENINTLVCSDFDETYYAHDLSNLEDVKQLNDYLMAEPNILFGVVSANTLIAIEQSMEKAQFTYYPHFISVNSGSELYFITENGLEYDIEYEHQLVGADFDKQIILDIEQTLNDENIPLIIQEPFINERFSRNYYYKETALSTDELHFKRIRELANQHGFKVNISKTNPMVGDPEGYYDVDIYPEGAGKDAIVKYLIAKYNIPYDHTYAFGDSGNDLKMLNSVKHGYLVNNATEDAKSQYQRVAAYAYNKGILSILKEIRRDT